MVWESDEVGKFVNSRFVSLRFSSLRDEYWKLRSLYKIKGVPAVIILDSEGNEVGRMIGFSKKKKDEYIQTLRDYAHGGRRISYAIHTERSVGVSLTDQIKHRYIECTQMRPPIILYYSYFKAFNGLVIAALID